MSKGTAVLVALLLAAVPFLMAEETAYAQTQPDEVACNPLVNGLASLAVPGLGHWLNGDPGAARLHFGVGLVNASLGALFWGVYGPVAVPAHLIWSFFSAIDATVSCLTRHIFAERRARTAR